MKIKNVIKLFVFFTGLAVCVWFGTNSFLNIVNSHYHKLYLQQEIQTTIIMGQVNYAVPAPDT